MKKRICFVGFESDPKAPESLKQAVSTSAWDSTFVSDGATALAAMASEPFDAVVANMQLTGTTGAELLQQVGSGYPKTLRFILGEVSDQEHVLTCIGGTHQFIAQPCKPNTLVSIIQRSLALDAWLSTDELRKIVPQLRRLPSLPSTYFEVLKQVESPNATVQSIGEVIARDPAATARLLQMVNSAMFSLSEKVTDPVHAVSLLGVETVKSLVLCLQVFSQGDQAKQAGLSFEQLWDHSTLVAKFARDITLFENGDTRMANEAFTAGLLHDVGRIVFASNLPKEYAAIVASARQHGRSLHEEETNQLGVTHAHVGAYLLGLWGMPASLVEATALHHIPNQSSTEELSTLAVVHVANVFAHEKDPRKDGLMLPKLDIGYLNTIGLMEKTESWRRALATDKPAADKSKTVPLKTSPPPVKSNTAPPAVAAATPSRGTRHFNWLTWLVVPTAAVFLVGVILWFVGRSGSKGDVRANARTPAPVQPVKAGLTSGRIAKPAATTVADPTSLTNIVAAARGFDSVRVQAIFYRASNPTVMINGKTLGVGERINGVEVAAIARTNVVLTYGKERKTFALQVR